MNYLKMVLLAGTIMLSAATASMGNTAPVSDAGEDQPVSVGSQVKLDGGASYDMDKDKLTEMGKKSRKMGVPVNGSLNFISLHARMQIVISYYGLIHTR